MAQGYLLPLSVEKIRNAMPCCLSMLTQPILLERDIDLKMTGRTIAIRMTMVTTTTKISTNVEALFRNPDHSF